MSDTRKKGKKGGKVVVRKLTFNEQIEAPVYRGYEEDDYEFNENDAKKPTDQDLDLEVEFKEDF